MCLTYHKSNIYVFLFCQETQVSAIKYLSYNEYKGFLAKQDNVPYDVSGRYGQLFDIIEKRYVIMIYTEAKTFITLLIHNFILSILGPCLSSIC